MKLNDEMPQEYKNGFATFHGHKFIVTPDVLVPRIDTEEILDLIPKVPGKMFADVGCGSGCIGISISLEIPKSTVYLSDSSSKALEIAKKNAKSNNCIFLKSDLMTNYPKNVLFDVIIANLPYVPTDRIPTLQSSVKDYEPHSALDGGPGGAVLINKLLNQLPHHLKQNGFAILEIDDTHTLKTFSIPEGFEGAIKKDIFNRNRFLLIRKKSMGQIL